MSYASSGFLALGLFLWLGTNAVPVHAFSVGADLSFLKQQEDAGTTFKDAGVTQPGLAIFKKHGYSWVRLRLFHSPQSLANNLEYTLSMAKSAKSRGFKLLLDFHYSDTWADPEHQEPPAAWVGLSHAVLVDSVYDYTKRVIVRFNAAGLMPDMVQIGNEINAGMLLPDGSSTDFKRLGDLLKAGVRGVDSGSAAGTSANPVGNQTEPGTKPLIMLHIASGGDTAGTKWFIGNAIAQGVRFEVIGQSYYPLWQGTFDDLRANMAFMGRTYAKDVWVVETAMTPFPEGGSPFPLTDAGQVLYLKELEKIVRATPNQRGLGLMWWEPTGAAYLGTSRGLFDRQGNARPAMQVFDSLPLALGPRFVEGDFGSRGPRNMEPESSTLPDPLLGWDYDLAGRRFPQRNMPGWRYRSRPLEILRKGP